MPIKVKLFASLRNKVGTKELEMNISAHEQVRDILKALNLSEKESFIFMINGVHCQLEQQLKEGDVLSIFPMIAGG